MVGQDERPIHRPWQQRAGAVSGLVFTALMLAATLIGGEPPQHREELTSHYAADANRTNDTILFFVLTAALLCFLWFLTALSERLDDAGHMSRLALLAGAACAVLLMAASTVYASTSVALQMHQDLVLDVDTHRLIRTVGTLLFVAALLAAIPFIAASSTAALQTRRLPRWLAWLGFPTALTFLAAPFDPSPPMFTLFTWTAVVSVVMLLRPAAAAKPVPAAEPTASRGADPASNQQVNTSPASPSSREPDRAQSGHSQWGHPAPGRTGRSPS